MSMITRTARINCDIAPNVFVRRSTAWKAEGKSDEWRPLDAASTKSQAPHNLGPVGDWLDAIAKKYADGNQELQKTISDRWLRSPKASFVYSVKL